MITDKEWTILPPISLNPSSTSSVQSKPENQSLYSIKRLLTAAVVSEQSSVSSKHIGYFLKSAGIPNYGMKSRVETHIKISLQMFHSESQNLVWKKVRLPTNNMANEKLVKSGFVIEDSNVLDLQVKVICPSRENAQAFACDSCIQREYRRKNKKFGNYNPYHESRIIEDELNYFKEQERIVLFNSSQYLDFSTQLIPITMRFTCYCRHHDEPNGFQVVFSLFDADRHLVASCKSPLIMITDDRKPLIPNGEIKLSRINEGNLFAKPSIRTIESVIPYESNIQGGCEIAIIGKNLDPATKVYFGVVAAPTLRYLGPDALIVRLPPSKFAGLVKVSLDIPEAPKSINFRYKDDSDQELYRIALRIFGVKYAGRNMDPDDVALKIINELGSGLTKNGAV